MIMTVLAVFIAIYALAVLLVPGFGPPFVAERRTMMPLALGAHLAGSLCALALGPWQLNSRLRARAIGMHRWMGRAYVVSVIVGGIGALALATVSQEGSSRTWDSGCSPCCGSRQRSRHICGFARAIRCCTASG
jgi:hypothetical protein